MIMGLRSVIFKIYKLKIKEIPQISICTEFLYKFKH